MTSASIDLVKSALSAKNHEIYDPYDIVHFIAEQFAEDWIQDQFDMLPHDKKIDSQFIQECIEGAFKITEGIVNGAIKGGDRQEMHNYIKRKKYENKAA